MASNVYATEPEWMAREFPSGEHRSDDETYALKQLLRRCDKKLAYFQSSGNDADYNQIADLREEIAAIV